MLAICQHCNKEFEPKPRTKGKYCSNTCWRSSEERKSLLRGKPTWNKGTKGLQVAWNKGLKGIQAGDKNPNWKGDKELEYKYAHEVIKQLYGRPRFCEDCKKMDQRRYEWANISGVFNRDRSSWRRLCKSCHLKFDKVMEKRKRGKDGKFIK